MNPPFKPLLSIGVSYIVDTCPQVAPNVLQYLQTILDGYIEGKISQYNAAAEYTKYIGTSLPLQKVTRILTVSPQPLKSIKEYPAEAQSFLLMKKTRSWSEIEDIRLIAGIHKYGLDSWGTIACFVGNSRTKAQCCQRWTRGLDPRITKMHWTPKEDAALLASISKHGIKSWTKVSNDIPSRSDVQCRYRYHQLISGNLPQHDSLIAQSPSEKPIISNETDNTPKNIIENSNLPPPSNLQASPDRSQKDKTPTKFKIPSIFLLVSQAEHRTVSIE
ncbi:Myb-like DNA-binding domain containing protein [Trichomonas vaginalis G3]|uniref:Myb-like DNA-binding domain containing protein n=1 Tax=Trichomonas vaginalis (strain ATCC PRA-98 / G3) TaxID=412133 RepID=A2FME6_TRIV3|nr:RNA polymerase II transcription regulator recruiting protein [Trichomonas vaginalis G3]EAX93921.1 Myb-like DNA-binding domain containing protein [Trichomonas vaginalis G3]KAI5523190.1 RNA polymerase II transcription regulator recruiting protein [Trichomonas vaginalis G3]|eukprot:XP_001306851.1 Myb-like DNA-binding domain containing protein [Trichomonas vaginalis G3]